MRFPRPMTIYKFDNEYDVLLFRFSLLVDRFLRDDNLFAAQCVWWLAKIIQYTEVLQYYRLYKILPSKYNYGDSVTLLLRNQISPQHSNADVSDLELDTNSSDTELSDQNTASTILIETE
jgi:hypothetical protein